MAEINEYAKRITEVLENKNNFVSLEYFKQWMRNKKYIIAGQNLSLWMRFKWNLYHMEGSDNYNKETWDRIEKEGDPTEILSSVFYWFRAKEHYQFWSSVADEFDETFNEKVQDLLIKPGECFDAIHPFNILVPSETVSVRNGNNITVPSNTNTWEQKSFTFKTEEDIIAEKLFDNMEFKNNIKILV